MGLVVGDHLLRFFHLVVALRQPLEALPHLLVGDGDLFVEEGFE
jgi:hypothetical protein